MISAAKERRMNWRTPLARCPSCGGDVGETVRLALVREQERWRKCGGWAGSATLAQAAVTAIRRHEARHIARRGEG